MMYTVEIDGRSTRVRMQGSDMIDNGYDIIRADEFEGGNHNYDGIRGVAVERAVAKMFGRNCFWFGNCDCISQGQVFEALPASKRDSNPGCSAVTGTTVLCIY